VKKQMKDRMKKIRHRMEEQEEEDFDEEGREQLDQENEKDEESLAELADVIGKIFKWHGPSFLGVFSEVLLQTVEQMLQPDRPYHDRQVAVCIFDDIVEFAQGDSLPLFGRFLPLAMQYIGDDNAAVRQAAVYGMGVCAQFGGQNFAQVVPEVLKRLITIITLPQAREGDNISATENAISAVGKICRYQSGAIDLAIVLEGWIGFLPVTDDKEESKVTYGNLCYFIETQPTLAFGEGYKNLPKILSLFAQTLGTKLIDEEVSQKMVAIMQLMQASFPAEFLQKALEALPQEQRLKLVGNGQ